jgi:hypothetical protein
LSLSRSGWSQGVERYQNFRACPFWQKTTAPICINRWIEGRGSNPSYKQGSPVSRGRKEHCQTKQYMLATFEKNELFRTVMIIENVYIMLRCFQSAFMCIVSKMHWVSRRDNLVGDK